MIAEKIQKAINKQINMELYSAYLYLSMAAHFQAANLNGFATWMKAQAKEELLHGMKLYDYVLDRDGRVALEAIAAPPDAWGSPLAAAEDAYRHERENTTLINDLVRSRQPGRRSRDRDLPALVHHGAGRGRIVGQSDRRETQAGRRLLRGSLVHGPRAGGAHLSGHRSRASRIEGPATDRGGRRP